MGIAAGTNYIQDRARFGALRPGYLIHDRDRICAWSIDESISDLGMIVPFTRFPKIRH
jgi:hypothetical protein